MFSSAFRVVAALALATTLAACRHVDQLSPRYAWVFDTDLCGWHVIVDENDVLWKESGCENGRPIARRVRRLRPDERAVLDEQLAKLPRDRTQLTPDEYAAVRDAFAALARLPEFPCQLSPELWFRDADGELRQWTVEVCEID